MSAWDSLLLIRRPIITISSIVKEAACPFCSIANSQEDEDLLAFRSENVFVIPTLVDPLLGVQRNKGPWTRALVTLRAKAGVWLTPDDV